VSTLPLRSRCEHAMEFRGRWKGRLEDCEAPVLIGCMFCPHQRPRRCDKGDESVCVPCARRYRGRVRRIALAGSGQRSFMVTLTAPGEDQHTDHHGDVCPCTPAGGVDLAEWNVTASANLNRFVLYLRRALGPVEYFKAAEVQQRGALHYHLIVRTEGNLRAVDVRPLAMRWGFGHSVKVDPVRDEKAAGYVAKYCSKSAGMRGTVPWRNVDRATGEVKTRATYRCWTASRSWGKTMAQVREEQRVWAITAAALRAACGAGGDPACGVPATLPPKAALDPDSRRYTPLPLSPPAVRVGRPM
jgi:hypothetical protein